MKNDFIIDPHLTHSALIPCYWVVMNSLTEILKLFVCGNLPGWRSIHLPVKITIAVSTKTKILVISPQNKSHVTPQQNQSIYLSSWSGYKLVKENNLIYWYTELSLLRRECNGLLLLTVRQRRYFLSAVMSSKRKCLLQSTSQSTH